MTLIRYTIAGIPSRYSTTSHAAAVKRLREFVVSYPGAYIVTEAVEGRPA